MENDNANTRARFSRDAKRAACNFPAVSRRVNGGKRSEP